jgi:hypothetical protein
MNSFSKYLAEGSIESLFTPEEEPFVFTSGFTDTKIGKVVNINLDKLVGFLDINQVYVEAEDVNLFGKKVMMGKAYGDKSTDPGLTFSCLRPWHDKNLIDIKIIKKQLMRDDNVKGVEFVLIEGRRSYLHIYFNADCIVLD